MPLCQHHLLFCIQHSVFCWLAFLSFQPLVPPQGQGGGISWLSISSPIPGVCIIDMLTLPHCCCCCSLPRIVWP